MQYNPDSSKIDALEDLVFGSVDHPRAVLRPERDDATSEPAILGLFHDPLDPVESRSLPTSTAPVTARGYRLIISAVS